MDPALLYVHGMMLEVKLIYLIIITGAIPVPRGFFGTGIGRIHLDDLQCNGTEERLVNCTHRGTGVHNCGHAEDAGVICLSKYDH